MTDSRTARLLEAALYWCRGGWSVFPIYEPLFSEGKLTGCSCGDPTCKSIGKHPRPANGSKGAAADEKVIRGWWGPDGTCPGANIGLVVPSGFVVIDVDPRNGGDDSLVDLEGRFGRLPETIHALTGGGGKHFLYSLPEGAKLQKSAGVFPGIDLKTAGTYIVVEPSVHASGHEYVWELAHRPGEFAVTPLPPALLAFFTKGDGKPCVAPPLPEKIVEGERHKHLLSAAGSMRRRNFGKDAILAALREVNAAKCSPQLEDAELVELAADVERRYTPAPATAGVNGTVKQEADAKEDPILDEGERAEREYVPPPVEALGDPFARFVREGADGYGVDPAYVMLPLLTAASGVIGNAVKIRLKPGFEQPAIVWSCVVGESGTGKSPSMEGALSPIKSYQRRMDAAHAKSQKEYAKQVAAFSAAKSKKPRVGPEPEEPTAPPVRVQRIISNATVEAIAEVLRANPRGVLQERDELSGWLKSFNQYKQQGGADLSHWLEFFDGRDARINRKTDNAYVFVPRASVSVCGGIQPGLLHSALPEEYHACGLAARLILAWPPRRRMTWSFERVLTETVKDAVERVFDRLLALTPENSDPMTGEISPKILDLSPEARVLWEKFYNEHHVEGETLAGSEASSWSKIELYAARFALILACVKAAFAGQQPVEVDADCIARSIQLVRWCGRETRRVFRVAKEGREAQDRRALLDWLRRRREALTANELRQIYRPLKGAGKAEAALEDLARRGYGTWQASPSGRKGHVERRFVVNAPQSGQGEHSRPVDNVGGGGSAPASEGEV